MKKWHYIIFFLAFLTVTFWWLYAMERVESKAVKEVLSIDEKILELRAKKFAKCGEISRVDLDKLDVIVKTCGEHLQLQ